MIQRQKPEILIVGLISSDSDFNARQEIMKKIVPSSLETYYFLDYLELNDIVASVSEKSDKEHLPSCGDKASGAKTSTCWFFFKNIIGKSKKIGHLISQIRMLANESCSVMIIGETGTGKELAARALHEWSDRRSNPFLALNCAAIPYTLFESEMFGTERGAYTDASSRSGIIEQANNGTLFLDEIGSLLLFHNHVCCAYSIMENSVDSEAFILARLNFGLLQPRAEINWAGLSAWVSRRSAIPHCQFRDRDSSSAREKRRHSFACAAFLWSVFNWSLQYREWCLGQDVFPQLAWQCSRAILGNYECVLAQKVGQDLR